MAATYVVNGQMAIKLGTRRSQQLMLQPGDRIVAEHIGNNRYRIVGIVDISGNTALPRPNPQIIGGEILAYNSNGIMSLTKASTTDVSSSIVDNNNSQLSAALYNNGGSIRETLQAMSINVGNMAVDVEETTTTNLNPLKINGLQGILGMPHQFMAITDPRYSSNRLDDADVGRVYYDYIVKTMPILIMTPGTPHFVPDATKSKRDEIFRLFKNYGSGKYVGKYYIMQFAYDEYFSYVNAMLRGAAHFLYLSDVVYQDSTLGNFHWQFFNSRQRTMNSYLSMFSNFFGEVINFGQEIVLLYANCGENTSDSFTNTITESQLASTINNLSDAAREANFIFGTTKSQMGNEDDGTGIAQNLKGFGEGAPGNLLKNIIDKGKAILAGGRLVFPQIWSDSSFERSYSCNMHLVSPSGDKLSIFMNILVPLFHLLGFVWPRQTNQGGQTYESPFLVRAYYKGMFNVDMGIIRNLSLTKGAEGEWTIDGLPTVADIEFEIQDLYHGIFMSKGDISASEGGDLMSNITELDYIANCCGINVDDSEERRGLVLYESFIRNSVVDAFSTGILNRFGKTGAQWLQYIHGKW